MPTKPSWSTNKTINAANSALTDAAPNIVLRRPTLSDKSPSGHCASAPPITVEAMNHAASEASLEIAAVKTGASDQNAPFAMPVASDPIVPVGEILNRRRRFTSTSCGFSGVCDFDNATGMAPSDTSTDATRKSSRPLGS